MGIVAAGMHDWLLRIIEPGGGLAALVGQPGGFLDRKGIHVRAVHHHRSRTVAQDAHHAGLADAGLDLEALLFQRSRYQCRGFRFLEGQLRVLVQLLEYLDQLGLVLFDEIVDTALEIHFRGLGRTGEQGHCQGSEQGAQVHCSIPLSCRAPMPRRASDCSCWGGRPDRAAVDKFLDLR
ncbi:hypothetical protein D3C78_589400 [compost metagenome]